ncbi:hypothetical protein T10_700 [Trichinella papuae]|uniref:Uncharacterized protein n=1 Tax=Trichinella papuae TaxID=268474 RepID=A0A0V1M342_9BILA|nr:hypothetical protein T10_7134 [Trichinella papuae]KRZ66267.1 hypothetical protein T10_10406 [Trichinella papuae]KRZ67769.1 hypothetical protein T10_2809 [Trichinella papuae]KRZ67787.1 hypothetical protein T10_700 [Trichinella papuae]
MQAQAILCDYSSFMHYIFTQILRYSHAVLDCANTEAHVLHFQACCCRKATSRSQRLFSSLPNH